MKTAFEHGATAFRNGKPAVPAHDAQFLETHLKGLSVGEGIEPLSEWARGWHEARRTQNTEELYVKTGKPALQVGDKVWVKGGFGMEEPQEVTVTWFGEHKGRWAFDYHDGHHSRWAYVSQIVEVGK